MSKLNLPNFEYGYKAGRPRFPAGWKIIKMALSAVLKAAIARDLKPRPKL